MVAGSAELCRITLVGPDRRADLAVPSTMPLAELMPQLVGFVVDEGRSEDPEQFGVWLVQRLGEAPFGSSATPQSADWIDGEILHLRRGDQPLPELDFDDVADAVATSVDRHADRWSPVAQRRLFIGLAVLGAVIAVAVLMRLPRPWDAVATGTAAIALALWCVRAARTGADGTVLRWAESLACAGGLIAGVEAAPLPWTEADGVPLLAGLLAVAGAAAIAAALLGIRATPVARDLPVVPPLAVVAVAVGVAALALLWRITGIRVADAAAVLVVLLVVLALLAPRLAVLGAGIRVPQLPRSAQEMRIDIEPLPAADIAKRAARADQYLTAGILGLSVLLVPSFWLVAHRPGWPALLLAAILTALTAMRAREVLTVQQRVALTAAAVSGLLAVLAVVLGSGDAGLALLVAGLALGGAAAAAATARRPVGRRLRPRWRQAVLVLEGMLAAACVPLLLGVLGVYAWARGLAG